jgi:hypothetical protein
MCILQCSCNYLLCTRAFCSNFFVLIIVIPIGFGGGWGAWLSNAATSTAKALSEASKEAAVALKAEAASIKEKASEGANYVASGNLAASIIDTAASTQKKLLGGEGWGPFSPQTKTKYQVPWEVEPVLISYASEIKERIVKLSNVDITFTLAADEDFVFNIDENANFIRALMELDKTVNLARLKHVKPEALTVRQHFRTTH